MGWKFWKSDDQGNEPVKNNEPVRNGEHKLSGPKELPDTVGRHLVVKLHKDPDWVWNLKAVVRHREESKSLFDIRVFDEVKTRANQVKVRDYRSFDEHPEEILFEGTFDKKSQKVIVEEKSKPETISRAA